jgi:hypothetical protein
MSKPLSAVSLLLAASATAGVVFASVQLSRTAAQLERMENRLALVEKAVSGPAAGDNHPAAAGAEGGGDAPGAPGKVETLADAIREVRRLREDVATLQERPAPVASATNPSNPPATGTSGGATMSPEETAMRKVVEDVLAAKEKEKAEADRKRMAEFQKARLERMVGDLTEKLGLSAQQKDQVAQILGTAGDKQAEIWANTKEGENPWPKVQELRKETDGQVKQYLTAEQQGKYDEYMKATNGGPRFGGGVTIQPAGGGATPK